MEKMKYDMAGGAAMIGAMRAIAQLQAGHPGHARSCRAWKICPAAARNGRAIS